MAKSCSNDGGDDDDVGSGEGKRKVDCEGEADDDDSDNDNDGVDINDGNAANGGDSMSKTHCDDDADGGGNSNYDGITDGDGIFENWCVDGEGLVLGLVPAGKLPPPCYSFTSPSPLNRTTSKTLLL